MIVNLRIIASQRSPRFNINFLAKNLFILKFLPILTKVILKHKFYPDGRNRLSNRFSVGKRETLVGVLPVLRKLID